MSEAKNDDSGLTPLLCVTLEDGKYTVILPRNGGLHALRYGEKWLDLTGDGLILALAYRIAELEDENAGLLAASDSLYQDVCTPATGDT